MKGRDVAFALVPSFVALLEVLFAGLVQSADRFAEKLAHVFKNHVFPIKIFHINAYLKSR